MVAVFLRLRLRQLANSLRRPPVQLLGVTVLLAYAVGATWFALRALAELRSFDMDIAGSVVVVLGSLLSLAFLAVPMFFGGDDPADPRACAPLGVPAPRVATGLAISAVVSVPAVLLIVIAVAQASVWSAHPAAAVVSVFGAVIIVVVGVLGARIARSVAAFWLYGKRARETVGLLALGGLLFATPAVLGIAATDWSTTESLDRVAELSRVLGNTPFGAAWAAPADAVAGNVGIAWFKLLVGVGFALALWVLWRLLVSRMLVTPQRSLTSHDPSGLAWFAWFPATPAGVIAARSLTYWVRDGRYRLAILAVPALPLLLVPPLLIAGVWWQNLALIPLPVMCLFLGWIVHNDTAMDNSAVWLHIAANTTGWADRFGRTVPALLLGVPLIVVGAPVSASLYGVPEALGSILGASVCLLLAGLGMSSFVSARYPYPTVRPGDNPFAQPQSTLTAPGQALAFLGTIAVTLPVFAAAGLGLALGGPWHLAALGAGLTIGVGMYYLGLSAGARVFARRAPELLAFSLRS